MIDRTPTRRRIAAADETGPERRRGESKDELEIWRRLISISSQAPAMRTRTDQRGPRAPE
jgi:hypothetical protein